MEPIRDVSPSRKQPHRPRQPAVRVVSGLFVKLGACTPGKMNLEAIDLMIFTYVWAMIAVMYVCATPKDAAHGARPPARRAPCWRSASASAPAKTTGAVQAPAARSTTCRMRAHVAACSCMAATPHAQAVVACNGQGPGERPERHGSAVHEHAACENPQCMHGLSGSVRILTLPPAWAQRNTHQGEGRLPLEAAHVAIKTVRAYAAATRLVHEHAHHATSWSVHWRVCPTH